MSSPCKKTHTWGDLSSGSSLSLALDQHLKTHDLTESDKKKVSNVFKHGTGPSCLKEDLDKHCSVATFIRDAFRKGIETTTKAAQLDNEDPDFDSLNAREGLHHLQAAYEVLFSVPYFP